MSQTHPSRDLPSRVLALLAAMALIVGLSPAVPAVATSHTILTVTTTTDAPLSAAGVACPASSGEECTLRAAVETANAGTGAYEITVPAGEYRLGVSDGDYSDGSATDGDLDVYGEVTITGAGSDATTGTRIVTELDYEYSSNTYYERHFDIDYDATVSLAGLRLSGGREIGLGGAVNNKGDLTVTDVAFVNNAAERGGAVSNRDYYDQATLTVIGSHFIQNEAFDHGGAIADDDTATPLTVTGSTFTGNRVTGLNSHGESIVSTHRVQITDTEITAAGASDSMAVVADDVSVARSTIRGHNGAAISSGGAVSVVDSLLEGNSRGVHFYTTSSTPGSVHVSGSTIAGNDTVRDSRSYGRGGAVYAVQANVTIENSTLSGNVATEDDPSFPAHGGAVYIEAAYDPIALALDSVTIAGNSSEGEGDAIYADNGGDQVTVELVNTLIENQAAAADCAGNGTFTSLGHNLDIDGSCGLTATGDQPSTDPLLATTLADNGGPTPTHALETTSPAIDAGGTDLAADQRGETRPVGAGDDIGAFEVQSTDGAAPGDIVVNSVADVAQGDRAATGSCDTGNSVGGDPECTLRAAVQAANERDDAPTIVLPSGTYVLDIVDSGTDDDSVNDLDLTAGLSIVGAGADTTVIDAGDRYRVFDIHTTGPAVTLSGLTITGGAAESTSGGGIHVQSGNVTLDEVTVSDNRALHGGGGISAVGTSTLAFRGGAVTGNRASYGGGISLTRSTTASIERASIRSNVSDSHGAGVNASGQLAIDDSTIETNVAGGGSASAYGGGIYVGAHGAVEVSTSTLNDNQALRCTNGCGSTALGGGVYVEDGGTIQLRESTVSGNHAPRVGGVRLKDYTGDGARSTVTNVSIVGNSSDSAPAGLQVAGNGFGDTAKLANVLLSGNVDQSAVSANCQLHPDDTVVTSGGGNVSDDGTCDAFATRYDDLRVSALGDHGGPTATHALGYDSPAVDAGVDACMPTDQRGAPRVDGTLDAPDTALCDAGAYEYLPPTAAWSALPGTVTQGTAADVVFTLRNPALGNRHDPVDVGIELDATEDFTWAGQATLELDNGETVAFELVDGDLVGRYAHGGSTLGWNTDVTLGGRLAIANGAPTGTYAMVLALVDVAGSPADGVEFHESPVVALTADAVDVAAAPSSGGGTAPPADEDAGPVEADAQDANGDPVALTVTDEADGPTHDGWALLDHVIAPDGDPGEEELRVEIRIDPSALPDTEGDDTLGVFADGVLAGSCPGQEVADPDPCVTSRDTQDDGTVVLVVLTGPSSTWRLGHPVAACPSQAVPDGGFADVASDDTHAGSIDCLAWWALTNGVEDDRYDPDGTMTRGPMASYVVRSLAAAGVPLPADPADAFPDDDGHTHEHAIDQLAAIGVVWGNTDGDYRPNAPVSRAQLASLLVRAYEHATGEALPAGPDAFVDDDGSAHEAAIDAAAAAGLTVGVGNGRFDPNAAVTRSQMASLMVGTLDRWVVRHVVSPPIA